MDIFDLYNFTVDESDFLDKEVSVDPEMLGKVFENLLEENLRKGKGTYYTPREIVNYMCEESLVNYLATEIGLTSENIKNKYFPAYNVLGDEKFEARDVSVSEQIIEKLKDIKVVDPACGSGAFLVGMLQQITHLRYELETRSKLLGRRDAISSEYEIKKQTIQNCIYGVDIDPGAVEIAKLRLWLSLVVDYELEDIEPLPNLDYKIMQGNSLLEELVLGDTTIKLYDRQTIQKAVNSKRMKNLFDEDPQIAMFDDIKKDQALKNMKALQVKYFSQSEASEKKKIKSQIEKIEHDLIEVSVKAEVDTLSAQRLNVRTIPGIGILPEDAKRLENITNRESQIMAVLDQLQKAGIKPFFLWHLHYSNVFEEKNGFDVVIANPPYGILNKKQNKSLGHQVASDTLKYLKKYSAYEPALGGMINVFRLFVCLSLQLLKDKGHSSLIFPMAFMGDLSASNLRKFVINENEIEYLEAFPERDNEKKRVFESVKMSVCILGANKVHEENKSFPLRIHMDKYVDVRNEKVLLSPSKVKNYDPVNYTIPLVNTEELEIINKVKSRSFRLEEIGKCYTGEIDLTLDKRFLTRNSTESKLIKGAQVQKYQLLEEMSQGEIMFLKADSYRKSTNSERSKHNEAQRIVMQGITGVNEKIRLKMTILDKNVYCANSVNYIFIKNPKYNIKYLLAILNSKLENWFYKTMSTNSNVNGYEVDNLPIPDISPEIQKPLVDQADKIFVITKDNNHLSRLDKQKLTNDFEKLIDQMVYELYGLTEQEVRIVEGKND